MNAHNWNTRRTNLVFARVGPLSLHQHWLNEPREKRNWDLQLSTWLPDLADQLREGDLPVYLHRSVKFVSIAAYFAEHPERLDRYEYIMLPDDDLLFDPNGISRMFDICREENLTLAQPALRPCSYFSHPIVLASPRFKLRYSNFVEPMAPVIKASYLADLLQYFVRWPTGWGQDEVWAFLMADPVKAAAIVDCAPMYHLRPLQSGEIYSAFSTLGMDPYRDLAEMLDSFANTRQGKLVYGGVLRSGRRVGRKRALLLFGLHLLRIATATRAPRQVTRLGLVALTHIFLAIGYRPRRAWPIAPPGTPTSAPHNVERLKESLACES